CNPSPPSKGAEEIRPSLCFSSAGGALNLGNSQNSLSARCLPLPTEPGWQPALRLAVWQGCAPSHPDHFPCSGYHRLKEGAVPTIFESFSKLRRTRTKGHGYPPGPPDVSRLRRCRKRCSEGRGPTTPFSPPPPADLTCFPVEEASAPAALSASPAGRLEPGLSSPFSDLLGPLGAQADEAGCSAQPSPERQPSPLEPRPVSPSAYMLRLPPPAGAYIQNEHSYQVGSALLWKRRAEAALDALDKAQ
ncbi:PREDICTED: THAP domain-containing protein 7, partial [Bison bison bison]|uniref:THAP domain-containing protein 7 n=1 Tax=Bison bison bison TaxID=43346 RepID=A0A6P3H8U2_BISBB